MILEDTHNISFYSISERALTISFGEGISIAANKRVMQWYEHLRHSSFTGFIESIPAFSTLTVVYNPMLVKEQTPRGRTVAKQVEEWLRANMRGKEQYKESAAYIHRIPVCYDAAFAPDLKVIAQHKNITVEEVVERHTAVTYQVFMMGFLPGFAYLGIADPVIAMPRLDQPRQLVPPGSVGIAGQQTGIYPLASPGGWRLIGRTPVSLFDPAAANPFLFRAGDAVQFYAISTMDFYQYINPADHEYRDH